MRKHLLSGISLFLTLFVFSLDAEAQKMLTRNVEEGAPKIKKGEIPGYPGTSRSYRAKDTSYLVIEPGKQYMEKGDLKFFLILGVMSEGWDRTLYAIPFLKKNPNVLLIAPNRSSDGKDDVQAILDCLTDAMITYEDVIDPARVYGAGYDRGAHALLQIAHYMLPGTFQGIVLSSSPFKDLGNGRSDWNKAFTNVAGTIRFHSGEDDSDRQAILKAFEGLSKAGRNVAYYEGRGKGEGPPRPIQVQEIFEDVMDGTTRDGQQIILQPSQTVKASPAGFDVNEDLPKEAKRTSRGDKIFPSVSVVHPSPLWFDDFAAFRGETTDASLIENITYFLYKPGNAPEQDAPLIVSFDSNPNGGTKFPYYKKLARKNGAYYLGLHNPEGVDTLWPDHAQRYLHAIHDVRTKHSIGKILLSGICQATQTATAVGYMMGNEVHGIATVGGGFLAGEKIHSLLQVRGFYLYAGGKGWSLPRVEETYRNLLSAGQNAKLMIGSGNHSQQPNDRQLQAMYNWLMEQ